MPGLAHLFILLQLGKVQLMRRGLQMRRNQERVSSSMIAGPLRPEALILACFSNSGVFPRFWQPDLASTLNHHIVTDKPCAQHHIRPDLFGGIHAVMDRQIPSCPEFCALRYDMDDDTPSSLFLIGLL